MRIGVSVPEVVKGHRVVLGAYVVIGVKHALRTHIVSVFSVVMGVITNPNTFIHIDRPRLGCRDVIAVMVTDFGVVPRLPASYMFFAVVQECLFKVGFPEADRAIVRLTLS